MLLLGMSGICVGSRQAHNSQQDLVLVPVYWCVQQRSAVHSSVAAVLRRRWLR